MKSTVSGIETAMVGSIATLHDEPALQDELAPLKRAAEQRFSGQHAHPEEAADETPAVA